MRDTGSFSTPSRARQDLHRLHQALLVLVEQDAGSLKRGLLTNELIQIHWRQLAHEDGGEECERALVALQEVVNSRLATDTVDKRLAADLVVRLQDVVNVLHDEVLVTHGASGWRSVLDPNDRSNAVDAERVALDHGRGVSLATVTRLVSLSTDIGYNAFRGQAYLFCRLSLK
jgi:hypothetical protein